MPVPTSIRSRVPAATSVPMPALLVGGLWSSLAAVALLAKLTDTLVKQPRRSFDRGLDRSTYRARNPLFDKTMSLASGAGEPWTL